MTRQVSLMLLCALVTGACAEGARRDMMSDQGSVLATALKKKYRQAIAVGKISGGQTTNPLWLSKVGDGAFRGALRQSLRSNALLAQSARRARYRLSANLITLDQPLTGLDMTVKTSVKYTLNDISIGRVAYDDIVSTSYTAKLRESLLVSERIRLANEGAIRANIEAFLRDLLDRARGGKARPVK